MCVCVFDVHQSFINRSTIIQIEGKENGEELLQQFLQDEASKAPETKSTKKSSSSSTKKPKHSHDKNTSQTTSSKSVNVEEKFAVENAEPEEEEEVPEFEVEAIVNKGFRGKRDRTGRNMWCVVIH